MSQLLSHVRILTTPSSVPFECSLLTAIARTHSDSFVELALSELGDPSYFSNGNYLSLPILYGVIRENAPYADRFGVIGGRTIFWSTMSLIFGWTICFRRPRPKARWLQVRKKRCAAFSKLKE